VFFDIRLSFVERPILSSGVVVALVFAFIYWLRNRRRRISYFRLDDGVGIRDFKDGLLGQNGNAKAD
jgi:protein disulfide-isomerase